MILSLLYNFECEVNPWIVKNKSWKILFILILKDETEVIEIQNTTMSN